MSSDSIEFLSARDRQGIAQHQRYAQERAATDSARPSAAENRTGTAENKGSNFFGEDGFGFDDFIDMINPLQHLPIVSTIYRAASGDEISPGARIVGGALFGGPIGFAAAVANAAVEEASGKDIGALALAAVGFDGEEAPGGDDIAPATMLAAAEPGTAPQPLAAAAEAPAALNGPSETTETPAPNPEPLIAISPAAGGAPDSRPVGQTAHDIPELSQDQMALLLRSVGLDQSALPAARPVSAEAVPSAVNASLIQANHSDDPYWSARVMLETFGGYTPDDTAPARGKLVNSNL